MPARTKKGLRPVIVYLPADTYSQVESDAALGVVPMSQVVRQIVMAHYAQRGATGTSMNSLTIHRGFGPQGER